mgnify:CR=1 FL=1
MSQDLEKFGMPEEELFAPVDHSDLESEKITAAKIFLLAFCIPCIF